MSRAAGIAFAAAGVALWLRVHNAFRYPPDWGFDARFNWQYILYLAKQWRLPAPDAGWSTADPPLYFALAALVHDLMPNRLVLVVGLNVLLGLAIAAMAVGFVRRLAPADPIRAWLAGGLVLYLPAHVYMSAMVNEEMLATACTTALLLGVATPRRREESGRPRWKRAAAAGAAAGLALLSKFSGLLGLGAALLAYASDARASEARRPALAAGALCLAVALALGGWFYARSMALYGSPQPFGLPAHQVMFEMPPGERGALDYLYVPAATFLDPQLLHPDLLRSVWGSLYASVWFDAHRSFLPTDDAHVRRLGTVTLLLALLPTLAFGVGVARALPRALRGDPVDLPLTALVFATLAGFAFYSFRNPWFAVLKGTTLLGLCVPYAVYASDTLLRWGRSSRAAGVATTATLALLALCVVASGTFDGWFVRNEVSGLPWRSVGAP